MLSHTLYWYTALFGTGVVMIRTVLMLFGSDLNAGDSDHGGMFGDADTASGSEHSFEVLSLFSLSAFFMTFGWVGLYCSEEIALAPGMTMLAATVAGAIALFVFGSIFKAASKLTSPGSSYTLEQLVGQTASVYERIPASGVGRIQIKAGDLLREISAVSIDKTDIESFSSVDVVSVFDSNTLAVRKKV